MTTKKFSNALGNIGDNYVDEAITYTTKKRAKPWLKWGGQLPLASYLLSH